MRRRSADFRPRLPPAEDYRVGHRFIAATFWVITAAVGQAASFAHGTTDHHYNEQQRQQKEAETLLAKQLQEEKGQHNIALVSSDDAERRRHQQRSRPLPPSARARTCRA